MLEQNELAAVNVLLVAIGDVPVNEITDPNPDVVAARVKLNENIGKVLSVGWWFNSDESLVLYPDVDGVVAIPPNAMEIDPTDTSSKLINRGGKFYDTQNHTYYINQPVTVDLVYFRELDEMPYTAYDAVVSRAAWKFAAYMELDATQLETLYGEYQEAWRKLQRSELKNRDVNILNSERAKMFLSQMPSRQRPV